MKGEAPARKRWERAFDRFWPSFERKVQEIGPLPASKLIPDLEDIFQRKTFNEPIDECTRQNWIDRFTGARETIARLKVFQSTMRTDDSYLLDLYNDLIVELDAYAMHMGALLLKEERFRVRPEDGKLEIGDGIKRACESRRGRIRQLVAHLLAPKCAPVLESESRRYQKLSSSEAKKTIMIHPAEDSIHPTWTKKRLSTAAKDVLQRCAASLWDFDRIFFYLVQQQRPDSNGEQLIECLERELDKFRTVEGGASVLPMQYAIRALQTNVSRARRRPPPKVDRLLSHVEQLLTEYRLDTEKGLRDDVEELQTILGNRGRRRSSGARSRE